MQRVLVWDIPTRLFHVFLAAGVLCAFLIAQFAGEHSRLFPYHALLGLVLAGMVLFRIVWGFFGTRYARFGSFLFGPTAVIAYMGSLFNSRGRRHVGHNPGSSYAIFLILGLVLVLAASGMLMPGGNDVAKEIHWIVAYAIIAVASIHVLGVIVHTVFQRENIIGSMVSGTKQAEDSAGIASAAPLAGVVFMVAVGLLTTGLYLNYDATTRSTTIPLTSVTVQLGGEETGHPEGVRGHHRDKDDN